MGGQYIAYAGRTDGRTDRQTDDMRHNIVRPKVSVGVYNA